MLSSVHKLNDGKYSAMQGPSSREDRWTCPPQLLDIEGHDNFCSPIFFGVVNCSCINFTAKILSRNW